jgi:hypothetical protein
MNVTVTLSGLPPDKCGVNWMNVTVTLSGLPPDKCGVN